MPHGPVTEFRAALRRLPVVALMVVATFSVTMAVVLLHRYHEEQRDRGAVDAPSFTDVLEATDAYAAGTAPAGRFEAEIDYSVLDGGDVSTRVTWDDEWFFQDATAYNHELARAASVISALAYAESNYYQASLEAPGLD